MGEIINLNNIENIICGRENQTVKAAYNIFQAPDDFFLTMTLGGEIYNKDTFDWTDGGRYVILTDENFEEIKAQTGKRISKIRIKYNNAYKIQPSYCGCNLIDLDTGMSGWGYEWVAVQWIDGIMLQTTIDGSRLDIQPKLYIGTDYLDKLSDGIYEFTYPENKNVWFSAMETAYNNLAIAYLIENI